MMTFKQFQSATKLSRSRIGQLIAQGMPVSRVPRPVGQRPGKALLQFDRQACRDWAAKHGLNLRLPVPGGVPATDEPGQQGAQLSLLEKTRAMEMTAFQRLELAFDGGDVAEMAFFQKEYSRCFKDLMQAEMSNLKMRKENGELVPFEPLKATWQRAAIGMKNSMLGIPHAIAPLVRPMLKQPDADINTVVRMLTDSIREALTAVSVSEQHA